MQDNNTLPLFAQGGTFELMFHQLEAVDAIIECIEEGKNPLLVMATGTGKTIVYAEVVRREIERFKKSLVLAHREELIDQGIVRIFQHTGYKPDKEKAELIAGRSSLCVVGSVQTMQNNRLASWNKGHFNLITVDEAHHAAAKTYRNILAHFEGYSLLGVTATPDRADQKQLGNIFNKVAYTYPLPKAIKDGNLVKIVGRRVTGFDIDLNKLKIVAGDYGDKELGDLLESHIIPIAKAVADETAANKTLVFMPNVASSKLLAETLKSMDIDADYIAGTLSSQDRKNALDKFSRGISSHLVSCAILLEGYDEPSIDCIVMLRPTGSRTLYAQAVGRGTRLYPGKEFLKLVEFTFNSQRLQLVTAYELFTQAGFEDKVRAAAVDKYAGADEHDFLLELDETKENYYDTKEIINRMIIPQYGFATFDPFSLGELIGVDLNGELDIEWNGRQVEGKITSKQKEILSRYNVAGFEQLDRAQATLLITTFFDKGFLPMQGTVSTGQAYYLRSKGIDPEGMTKAQASMLIGKLKAEENSGHQTSGGSAKTSTKLRF